jgi:cytochrome c oxidase subunit 5a
VIYSAVRYSSHAAAEDYDSFNKRYADFFASTHDLFELQRALNNAFAYDIVPSQQGKP